MKQDAISVPCVWSVTEWSEKWKKERERHVTAGFSDSEHVISHVISSYRENPLNKEGGEDCLSTNTHNASGCLASQPRPCIMSVR